MTTDLGYDGELTCAFPCSDLERSLAWYRDVLGFTLLYKLDDMGWCELRTGVDHVNVGLSQVEAPDVKGGPTVVFGVGDIERTRRALEEQDVRFDGEIQTIEGMVRLTTFYDPDGHKLMLAQDLEKGS
jgi:catechol 2,3-dioxygenase-like lactoylglutathione lyase family enzyme